MAGCRQVVDNVDSLELGMAARLCASRDALMPLLACVKSRPWERRRGTGLQRYVGGAWQAVNAANCAEICQPEAQVTGRPFLYCSLSSAVHSLTPPPPGPLLGVMGCGIKDTIWARLTT